MWQATWRSQRIQRAAEGTNRYGTCVPHRGHAEPTILGLPLRQAACSSREDDASSAPMGLESGQQPSGQSTRGSIQPHLPVGRQLRPLLFEVQVRWSQGCCNDPTTYRDYHRSPTDRPGCRGRSHATLGTTNFLWGLSRGSAPATPQGCGSREWQANLLCVWMSGWTLHRA